MLAYICAGCKLQRGMSGRECHYVSCMDYCAVTAQRRRAVYQSFRPCKAEKVSGDVYDRQEINPFLKIGMPFLLMASFWHRL